MTFISSIVDYQMKAKTLIMEQGKVALRDCINRTYFESVLGDLEGKNLKLIQAWNAKQLLDKKNSDFQFTNLNLALFYFLRKTR